MPGRVFQKAAARILPSWDISLFLTTPKEAQSLNRALRNKTYIPNVLSYAVGEKNGEVILCPSEAKKQAHTFSLAPDDFLLLLFIHGLLHLKGMRHGTTMERLERKLLARVSDTYPHGTTHSNRNRHRHISGKSSRR